MPKVYNKHHNDAPPDAVYVGRPSKWGNPYAISDWGYNRDQAIAKFRQYAAEPNFNALIKQELKGKDLVCFCAPKACHADVLLEIANE